MAKKLRVEDFDLFEISAVDSPAVQGAIPLIQKAQDVAKRGKLVAATSLVNGHEHAIKVGETYQGASKIVVVRVVPAISEGSTNEHSHEIFLNGSGKWQITSESGHSHSVSSAPIETEIAALNRTPDSMLTPKPPPGGYPANKGTTNMKTNLELAMATQLGSGDFDHLGGKEIRKAILAPVLGMQDKEEREHALQALTRIIHED